MKKLLTIILALTMIFALFAGCGSSENSFDMSSSAMQSPAPMAAPAAPAAESRAIASKGFQMTAEAEMAMPEEAPMDMRDEAAMESSIAGGGDEGGIAGPLANPVVDSRKIIKNVSMQLQTQSFDKAVDSVSRIAESFGGYIQDSYIEGRDMYNERGARAANFTIRIPSDALDSFVNSFGGDEFNVISKSQNSEDVTERYFDSKARLDALKVQEERLMAMLEKAAELEYLLQVEKELMNVRYEIESLTASLKRLDSYVSLSTATIYLVEVVKYEPVENLPITFSERVSRAFAYSWKNFSEFSQDFAVGLISVLPFLLFLLVIVLIILIIIRRSAKKYKRNAPAPNASAYVAPSFNPAPPAASNEAPAPDGEDKK